MQAGGRNGAGRPAGVLSDVCSALRACADILPDLDHLGPWPR